MNSISFCDLNSLAIRIGLFAFRFGVFSVFYAKIDPSGIDKKR